MSAVPASAEVLVVGAGMAGLTAAKSLRDSGIGVRVIEARDRVGGRIHTVRESGQAPRELGAQVVHGAAHPVFTVVDRDREATHIDGGELAARMHVDDLRLPLDGTAPVIGPMAALRRLRNLPRVMGPLAGQLPVPAAAEIARIDERGLRALGQWVEQVSGVPLERLTVDRVVSDPALSPPPGEKYLLNDGMSAVPQRLAQGLEVTVGSPVAAIALCDNAVRVTLRSGQELTAALVVLTVPPPVIAAGLIALPDLPADQRQAAAALTAAPAVVVHVSLVAPAQDHGFVFDVELGFATWHRGEQHLTVVSKGRQAGRTAEWARDPARMRAWAGRLPGVTPAPEGEITAYDWGTDPYALGGFTIAPEPSDPVADIWRRPIGGRIVIAGEAALADAGHPYLDRAARSGELAADAVRRLHPRKAVA